MMDIQPLTKGHELHWMKLLNHSEEIHLDALLHPALLRPVNEFLGSPGKNIRSKLIRIGYSLAQNFETAPTPQTECLIEELAAIVEAFHGGALIVDDIQDQSIMRRNLPTLHLRYGMPTALNAANWLYFWALERVRQTGLLPEAKAQLWESSLRLLSLAHEGQALDVGTRIDEVPQRDIFKTCLASMELKTGTLLSLALVMGGVVAGASNEKMKELECLGAKLGIALQMFDDLGNFFSPQESFYKRHEDLKLRRPTWIWAQASKMDPGRFNDFLTAVRSMPNEEKINQWVEDREFFDFCLETPLKCLRDTSEELVSRYQQTHPLTLSQILEIGSLLEKAYVKKD